MPDPSSPSEESASFSDPQQSGPESNWTDSATPGDAPLSMGDRSSFALDMARMWVEEHQTSVMLGAFAVGVFTGALLRD